MKTGGDVMRGDGYIPGEYSSPYLVTCQQTGRAAASNGAARADYDFRRSARYYAQKNLLSLEEMSTAPIISFSLEMYIHDTTPTSSF